jgi:hypothetical protein
MDFGRLGVRGQDLGGVCVARLHVRGRIDGGLRDGGLGDGGLGDGGRSGAREPTGESGVRHGYPSEGRARGV